MEVIDALENEEVEKFESGSFQDENFDCAGSQKGIGYEAMRLINPIEQMPMCPAKVKEVTYYLENKGSSGPHVERYVRRFKIVAEKNLSSMLVLENSLFRNANWLFFDEMAKLV